MKYSALIVAAGSGSRMKLGYNKVYAKLEDGTYILEKTISVFQKDPDCQEIIVVTDPLLYREKIASRMPGKIVLAVGGKTRQESVCHGLMAVLSDYVMIHDGARPYLTQDRIDALKETLETEDAALLAVPSKDTIKKVENGYITTTYDRNSLVCAQTPQAFCTDLIIRCMERAIIDGFTGTDDCSLVEKYSDTKIKVVEGDYTNKKITTPEDIVKAM